MKLLTEKKPGLYEHYYENGQRMICFWITDEQISWEDGPVHPTARSHEGAGSSQKNQDFLDDPVKWIFEFPGMYEELKEILLSRGN